MRGGERRAVGRRWRVIHGEEVRDGGLCQRSYIAVLLQPSFAASAEGGWRAEDVEGRTAAWTVEKLHD